MVDSLEFRVNDVNIARVVGFEGGVRVHLSVVQLNLFIPQGLDIKLEVEVLEVEGCSEGEWKVDFPLGVESSVDAVVTLLVGAWQVNASLDVGLGAGSEEEDTL